MWWLGGQHGLYEMLPKINRYINNCGRGVKQLQNTNNPHCNPFTKGKKIIVTTQQSRKDNPRNKTAPKSPLGTEYISSKTENEELAASQLLSLSTSQTNCSLTMETSRRDHKAPSCPGLLWHSGTKCLTGEACCPGPQVYTYVRRWWRLSALTTSGQGRFSSARPT